MAVIDNRAALDLDPELKGWVLDFIHERKRVTVEDIRREFFPDEMGAPYLYLDRLTAEGRARPVSEGLEPTRWSPVLVTESKETPRERRPDKRVRPKKSTARSRAQALADGEVHELTWLEIEERFGFEEFRQFRNFLRSYARRHIDIQLSIQRTDTGVKFCMGEPPLKWESQKSGAWYAPKSDHSQCEHPKTSAAREKCRNNPNRRASTLKGGAHKECTHPPTSYAREKCREGRGQFSPSHLTEGRVRLQVDVDEPRMPSAAQILKAMKPKPAPKPKRVPKPPRPQLSPEEVKAKQKRWNNGSGLTAPRLSHFIYKRMRANRDRQYVFSREWLYRQYPGVTTEMVDAALQHLVDKGRISELPK
ncbi:hypothetical protein PV729_07730 [Streptomyces europaeiscabiei]|uniref:Uncharacterized protein n=1 Tax=Streptomyces europaeiscabiei TaxID=146819 RepID=A0ABU4NAP3_9ACTN|nr:hypothetical protein [Streptomyces europaeiscabiei]MDX3541320.1 hypothetical protein [Streptomyces europaeiscabiei]MDX3551661.1 hypothetical protein [Streptomyces europaeiscabiei]MDX3699900.1 hypothetical protein [Streptomyces europaeiscabiei]